MVFSFYFLCRVKIFVPIALLAWTILVPVNWTATGLAALDLAKNATSSDIDKLSISNVEDGSHRFGISFLAYSANCKFCFEILPNSVLSS